MSRFWMPPMDRVLELDARLGITGHEEPVIADGDLGHIEHTIHELGHAILLQPWVDLERGRVSDEISTVAFINGVFMNEIETFAVETFVIRELRIPGIDDGDIMMALEMQMDGCERDGIDDPEEEYERLLDEPHIIEAGKQLCEMLAPDGPRLSAYCSSAALTRVVRSGEEIAVYPMLNGNARLCIGEPDGISYRDAWCYQTDESMSGMEKALYGAWTWDGEGDPPGGWYRNPLTGRRRPDGDPRKEFVRA